LFTPFLLTLEEFEEFADKMRHERAEKEAEKKSDRRFQTKQTLLGAVVGSILTLLVEHFSGIVSFISGLLH